MNNYDTLNPMQREAVFTTEGPLLVLAGAGSGKTRALTHRVAYLIEEKGVKPWNILAITFTNKAAGEMRDRVNSLVEYGADSVWVSTFHSLCVRILRRFIENIGYTTDFSIYDSDDTKTLMKQIFKDLEVNTKVLKERGVLGVISSAKNEMISPEEFMLSAKAEGDSRLKRIAELYMEYQKRLKKNNALDFDDLLVKTVELFQTKQEVLEYYQDRFRYIMVDEYQDTNTVQFKLVSLLAAKYRNICVVGDDDQSIYRFRGANIRNILSFEETFPGAKVIKLEHYYGSTKFILDSANYLIRNNTGRKDKTLWTENEVGERPVFREFPSSFEEAEWIVRDIVKKGGPWKDYAILYRTNAQSRIFEEKCIAYNLPYRLVGGVNFYQRKEIKDVLCYLKTIANGRDDLAVQRIINVPKRGIGAMSVARVNMFAMENDMSFYEALERVQAVPGIGKAALKIGVFTDQIGEFRKMLKEGTPIKDVIEAILNKTGYSDELKQEGEVEAESRMENIEELINKAVSYWESAEEPSLSAFLEEVALVADIDSMDESEDRIILMTLHSAKGLEFPYVYLAGMEDGLFPSMMSLMEGPEALEEERRLCYVGITRAEKRLTLTAAKSRMIKGQVQPERTSRFIDEIPDVCLERPDRDDSKTGWKKMADAYRDLPEEAGLPWAKASGADGKAADSHTGRFQNRPAGVSLFGQKTDVYKNPYASGTSAAPKNTPTFGKSFTVEKPKSLDYSEGDRVHHMRFGDGTVKSIADGGKDFEVTVDFDNAEIGTRKMFASFAKLKKL